MTTPPGIVNCFSHLGIAVSDRDASVEFYTRVLGFVVCFTDIEEGWTRVGLAIGNTLIELFSRRPTPEPGSTVDPFYPMELGRPKIALTVVDVEATYERLVAADITPLCPIIASSVSRFFFISDPDCTPIQLHEFSGGQQRVAELFRS